MKCSLFTTLLVLLVATICVQSKKRFAAPNDNRVNIWPQPTTIEQSNTAIAVLRDWITFSINTVHAETTIEAEILSDAYKRFKEITFYESIPTTLKILCSASVICVQKLDVNIKSTEKTLTHTFASDESYTLVVDTTDTIRIEANTVWGALHGLETLSQMIQVDVIDGVRLYSLKGFQVPLKIFDSPRFKWRGLLVDTSRHYLSVAKMRHIIDSLTYIKMNVLHWHIVDADSFPAVIPQVPELSKGAWAQAATYSPEDVTSLVDYAFRRGVRVVFEFDMPGHTVAWGVGRPNIMAKCPGKESIMNPTVEETYQVIDGVFAYVKNISKDAYVHIGGDEIASDCWKADAQIQQWMKDKGYSSIDELLSYFERRVLDLLKKHKLAANVWEEVLLNYDQGVVQLPKDTVVTAWTTIDKLPKIIKAGYPSILSAGWYLDQQSPNSVHHYSWVDTWISFYNIEPNSIGNFTQDEQKLLLGGEACMWGEAVDDINFDSRVFPRVLAVAERLWSPQNVNVVDGVTRARINHHRCNMVRRGVYGGPVSSGYCDATYSLKKMSWQ